MGNRLSRGAVRRWGGVALATAVIAAMTSFGWPAMAAEEIRGKAKVISGNEIHIGKRVVRLFGMTAPELDDICPLGDAKIRCGIVAWSELIKLADGRYISCDVETKDAQTVFATCYMSEADLNEALVRSGWAKAVPEQTDRYVVDETDAKESQRGLWSHYKPSRKRKSAKAKK